MFELLEKVEKLFEFRSKVVGWLKRRYVIESSIVLPRKVALPFWNRFWALNSYRIILDALLFLAFVTLLRYLLAYLHLVTTFGLVSKELSLKVAVLAALPSVLEVLVYFTSLSIVVGMIILALQGSLRNRALLLRSVLLLCLLTVNYLFKNARPLLIQSAIASAYRSAVELFQEEKYSDARRIFRRLLQEKEVRVAPRVVLEAYEAGTNYHEENYKEAMDSSCRILSKYPSLDPELRENMATTLHWSINGLAQTTEFSLADELLNETRGKYGGLCAIESSPYWLAISPELWSYMVVAVDEFEEYGLRNYQDFIESEEKQGRGDAEHLRRYYTDRSRMEYLLEKHPTEKYAEHILYLLGEYDVILTEYRTSSINHLALYAKGVQAFEQGVYRDAISHFTQFLLEYPSHKWADSAYSRVSRSYLQLGDKVQALHNILLAQGVSDGIPWDLTTQAVHLLEVYMTSAEIQQFLSERTIYGFDDLLEFSLAQKHFDEGHWTRASLELATIARKYPGSRAGIYAEHDLRMLADVLSIINNYDEAADFYLGKLFYYSDDPVFYNEFWRHNRHNTLAQHPAPESFYWRNNDFLRAGGLFHAFASQNSSHPLAEESLFMAGKSHEMAAVTGFLASQDMIEQIRWKAVQLYREYLERYMDHNKERTDEAIQSLGLIWLHKMEYAESILDLHSPQELERMREEFRSFVDAHRSHHLANNVLNWIGWSYCLEANLYPPGSSDWQNNYLNALEIYGRITQDYPLGLTAQTALKNAKRISEKLNNPSPVEEDGWYWYGYGEIGYYQYRECFYIPANLDRFSIKVRRYEDVSVNIFDNDGAKVTRASTNVSVSRSYDESLDDYVDLYEMQDPQPGFWCVRGPEDHFAIYIERVP